mgnify:FL=1
MNSKTYIAHRGWHNKYAPENSLEAFKQALEKNLAIEFDLQMTRDKQIVVFHDSNLKRMCGIDKSINSCAYEEIKNLKLKNSQETIPLLSDVLKLVNGKVLLDIEIKNTKYIFRSVDVISHILNNYQGPYTIKSFNPLISYIYKKKNPNISCGVLVGDLKNTKVPKFFQNTFLNIRYLPLYKPDFIAYNVDLINDFIIAKLKKNNIPLHLYTIDTLAKLNKAQSISDILIIDNIKEKD